MQGAFVVGGGVGVVAERLAGGAAHDQQVRREEIGAVAEGEARVCLARGGGRVLGGEGEPRQPEVGVLEERPPRLGHRAGASDDRRQNPAGAEPIAAIDQLVRLAVPGGNPLDRATYFTNFTGRVGNLGRNTLIGPDYLTLDTRLSKFIRIHNTKIEGFVEAFNVTNRVNLGVPTGNLRSASFGTSTALAQGAASRQVELGFRFDF